MVKDVDRRRDRRRAAVHGAACRRRGGAELARSASPAQNLYWEREGAFTGEISAAMLKEAGAEYVIIGHSERRRLFGETDETVNRKLVAALGAQLTPIVCIGETLEERERERDARGARSADQGGPRRADRRSGRARWSSPTSRSGRSAPAATRRPQQAGEAHAHIRTRLRQWFGGAGRGPVPRDLRRQREARQHPRADAAAGRRRRAGRRRQPRRPGRSSRSWRGAARARYNRALCSTTWSPIVYVLVVLPAAAGRPAAAGQGRRHGERVRRRQQPDGVRRARRRDGADARRRRCSACCSCSARSALGVIGQRGPGSLMSGLGGPAPAPAAPPAQHAGAGGQTPAHSTPAPDASADDAGSSAAEQPKQVRAARHPPRGSGGIGRRTSLRGWR